MLPAGTLAMKRYFAFDDWTLHPALRMLVLAWVAIASQTPGAAWGWALCLAIGALGAAASWWRQQSAQVRVAPPVALHELLPASPVAPTRRRTDATRAAAPVPPEPAKPVLKAHLDALHGLNTPAHLDDTSEPWERDLLERKLALCILRVGLDGFDSVTERYGPTASDEALAQVAKRLRHLARDEDRVMRLDAAEFVLLLSCPLDEATAFARSVAARVVGELQRPFAYRTVSNLHIGASVGAALWPANGAALSDVLEHAEEALADARHGGRGQVRQYAAADETVTA